MTGGQGAFAGQLLPCCQTAGEDVRLHPAIELFIQAESRLFVQGIGEHWTGSFHLVLTSKIKMDILIIPVATIIQIVNESKGFFNSYPLTPLWRSPFPCGAGAASHSRKKKIAS